MCGRKSLSRREAVKLGLSHDKDDSIIQAPLQQKMEFVATDLATAEATEPAAWLAKHPDNFRHEPRFSFTVTFFQPRTNVATASRPTCRSCWPI